MVVPRGEYGLSIIGTFDIFLGSNDARRLGMVTRAIRLGEEETASLHEFAERIGEDEAIALREAALRGLREYWLGKAFAAYCEHGDSYEAAEIAGLPRAIFLWEMAEHGEVMLQGPSTLAEELLILGQRLGDERLTKAARIAQEYAKA